jgi:hypothetical protein
MPVPGSVLAVPPVGAFAPGDEGAHDGQASGRQGTVVVANSGTLRGGTVPGRVERLREPAAWGRRGEPPRTGRGFGERDAEEAPYPAVATADDRACGSMHGDRLAWVNHDHRNPDPEMPCTK